jgi:hypothetical protein
MNKYAEVALRATKLMRASACASPVESWHLAAREVFPGKVPSQKKGCPKGAYLGLCEEGLVAGVPAGHYTKSRDNKAYAVEAVRLLVGEPGLASEGPSALWQRVMNGTLKAQNHQMDVVLALWAHDMIVRTR